MDWSAALCYYPAVSVADIQSFSVAENGHNVNLLFTIQGGADPGESAAVYVADNPAGPARLVGALTGPANLMPGTNNRVDDLRLPPAGSYYYWLDYDDTPFPDLRPPAGLYAASGNPAGVTGPARVILDAPEILSVTDVPFDRGGHNTIAWALSLDDASLDGYNLYRNTYPGGHPEQGEWIWLTGLPAGTSLFVDPSAPISYVTEYRVSAAHHGAYTVATGSGNTGIWNEFSNTVAGTSVDNFAQTQVTLLSNDTLTVCPAGDRHAFQTELIVFGSHNQPTVGIPTSMLECALSADTLRSCLGVLIADTPTDAMGKTTFTASKLGGHGRVRMTHRLANSFTHFGYVDVYLRSPDETGDGMVALNDWSLFSTGYVNNQFRWWRDFDASGTVNLADFSTFYAHYNHVCPTSPLVTASSAAGGRVDITYVDESSATSSRQFYVDVRLADVPAFSVAMVGVRNETPGLAFQRFEPGSFPGTVLVADVERNGVREVGLGVVGGAALRGKTADLGRLVYEVEREGAVELASGDFEVRVADIMLDGGAARLSSSTSSVAEVVPRVVRDELAPNHPNPFNPTTTITYSIARPGTVSLRIFSVDGREVRTLVNEAQTPDVYRVTWDGTDNGGSRVSSGVYFYRLTGTGFNATRKMVLLK